MLCRHPVCPNPALYALPRWFFGTGGAPFFWGAVGFAQKDPGRIGGENYFSGEGAKKTSENAAALCVFAPLREKCPRQQTLFVQGLLR